MNSDEIKAARAALRAAGGQDPLAELEAVLAIGAKPSSDVTPDEAALWQRVHGELDAHGLNRAATLNRSIGPVVEWMRERAAAPVGGQAEPSDALIRLRRFAEGKAITARANGGRGERDWLDVLALLDLHPAAAVSA